MSFIETHFVYDGVKSEDMGISLIKMEGGFIESQFFADRVINYELVDGGRTPYIYSDTIEPLQLNLQLSPLEGKWTSELRHQVSMWLNNGKYNEFYSTDDIDRRYFITYTGSPTLFKTGLNQGYIDVQFLNIDCYVRSPLYQRFFDLSEINSPTVVEIMNLGIKTQPMELSIEKIGSGDVTVKNLSNRGVETKLTGLSNNEVVVIRNKDRHIESSIPDRYLYDSFNGNYLTLVYGMNRLEITGSCRLNLKYRHEYLS